MFDRCLHRNIVIGEIITTYKEGTDNLHINYKIIIRDDNYL